MPNEKVTVTTKDGQCAVYVSTPESGAKCPAVIMYTDAGGIRPAALEMGARLAEAGYVVLVPDIFYRYGPYGPFDPKEVLKDFRAVLGPLMATTSNAKAAEDTQALLNYIDTRADVRGTKLGAVGFCMGGGMAVAAAGTYPDRFAASISFHGGRLATDAPDSPHNYAPNLKAELYIGVAENDDSYPPEMAQTFEHALNDARVSFRSEMYNAKHGWMMPDFPVYDEPAAERGWREMLALFERALQKA
jgi:carboxymethylenebutenolidase